MNVEWVLLGLPAFSYILPGLGWAGSCVVGSRRPSRYAHGSCRDKSDVRKTPKVEVSCQPKPRLKRSQGPEPSVAPLSDPVARTSSPHQNFMRLSLLRGEDRSERPASLFMTPDSSEVRTRFPASDTNDPTATNTTAATGRTRLSLWGPLRLRSPLKTSVHQGK